MGISPKLVIAILLLSPASLLAQDNFSGFQKGDVRLDIKLPHVNYLMLNPNKEFKDSKLGFNGYGLGFEYNYNDDRFIEVSSSIATTFNLPFPAPVDAEYNKILYSFYINLTDNVIKNNYTIGYGLNYSANTWKEWTRDLGGATRTGSSDTKFTNSNFGLTFNSYYRVTNALHLGLIYQPSLLNLNNKPRMIYEHLISLEANWRIRISRSRNGN